AAPPRGNGSALVADSGPLDAVVQRTFTAYGFRLQSGRVLPEMALAYETYGRLAADGRNATLSTHGGTSTGQAAGQYPPTPGVQRLPGLPVGRDVSGPHARRRARGDEAERTNAVHQRADRSLREGSELERRLALRARRNRGDDDGAAVRDAPALRRQRDVRGG